MNTTATSKSKLKFSSRNLNAVFKAPLGTKPLPDNATGPLQRPNSHMLVLGRAAVAPPAPLNTPSLKSENQVQDVHVSLVPAGSNWAKNAEKCLENEVPDHLPDAANVAASTAVSTKVWTSKSVVEHLHDACSGTARPKVMVETSGRWGDDAVENDSVQTTLRHQIQKEREFPDLKKTREVAPTCHGHGHFSVASEMQSMDLIQEPEPRHGRATGRWAHFKKEETHRSIQDTNNRWSHSQYGRDEDDRWFRGRSRYDADYGLESRRHEGKRNAGSPDFVDCHTHFSRSDVRFDIVASGDGNRALSASPDEDSCDHALQPFRASFSPLPPVLASGSIAVDLASGRKDHGLDRARENRHCTNTEWSKNEKSSTLVAEEMQSSTESSSTSLSHSSPSPSQQVQLLKRPKMLFDPKTGGTLNVEDIMRLDKRQTGGRSGGKDHTSKSSGSSRAGKRAGCKSEEQAKASTPKSKSVRGGRKEANSTPGVVDGSSSASQIVVGAVEQESADKSAACIIETSSPTSLNAAGLMTSQADSKVVSNGSRVKRNSKHVTAKQPPRQESKSRVTKPPRDACPLTSRTARPKQQHRNAHHTTVVNVRGSSTPSRDKAADCIKRNISTQCDRLEAECNKPAQHGLNARKGDMLKPNPDLVETALPTQTADEFNSGVVVLTEKQQGIEVSPDDNGFETVKSRRVVLFEKKQLRERVIATVTLTPIDHASLEEPVGVQRKEAQEKLGMAAKVSKVATEPVSFRPRRKAADSHRNSNEVTKDKDSNRASKQTTRTRGLKKVSAKIAVDASYTESTEQMASRPTEQVAGEAPTESLLLKKSAKVTEASMKARKDRQSDEARDISTCNVNDGIRTTRKQKQSKRQDVKRSPCNGVRSEGSAATKSRLLDGSTIAKARSKQKVRQVYVVKKTLVPAPASGVSSK